MRFLNTWGPEVRFEASAHQQSHEQQFGLLVASGDRSGP